jgi:hypothetical protein
LQTKKASRFSMQSPRTGTQLKTTANAGGGVLVQAAEYRSSRLNEVDMIRAELLPLAGRRADDAPSTKAQRQRWHFLAAYTNDERDNRTSGYGCQSDSRCRRNITGLRSGRLSSLVGRGRTCSPHPHRSGIRRPTAISQISRRLA